MEELAHEIAASIVAELTAKRPSLRPELSVEEDMSITSVVEMRGALSEGLNAALVRAMAKRIVPLLEANAFLDLESLVPALQDALAEAKADLGI